MKWLLLFANALYAGTVISTITNDDGAAILGTMATVDAAAFVMRK